MSNRPEDRKRKEAEEKFVEDIFSLDIESVEPDPIYKMRKYVTHFRLMVFLDHFDYIKEGSVLSYGKPGKVNYPEGVVTNGGLIHIPRLEKTVSSLTAFATEVVPDTWTKTEKSGKVGRARPDGWERVWVRLDNGAQLKVEDVLFKHHEETGYTVEQLSDIPFIQNEIKNLGFGEYIKDLESEAKAWATSQKKSASKSE